MLTPGAETDLKVAKACGYVAEILHLHVPVCIRKTEPGEIVDPIWEKAFGNRDRITFKPSTDLNDAFLAAEKVELFDDARCSLQHWHVGWAVVDEMLEESTPISQRIIQAASTPALAICAAILKLAESRK